ncbi:MAG: pilus assembly protein PilM [Planctomycetes bacterium]|nr:pilus assembly protein PilM [Planctomycetota bacterium]
MATGLDIGSYSIKALRLRRRNSRLQVTGVARTRLFAGQEPGADPRARAAEELPRLAAAAGLGGGALVGLTGRDLNLRFTQVPPVAPDQVQAMMEHEVIQIAGKSGGLVYSDHLGLDYPWKPLPIPMIVALGKTAFVDERMLLLARGGVRVRDLVPNSIALFHAWRALTPVSPETILLVDVGAENLELVFAREGRLVFARNVAGGGRVFTEALAGTLKVTPAKAEELKCREGSLNHAATDGARMALLNAAGQIQSLIQSSISFARTQTQLPDLSPDRVLVSGGGARVDGLLANLAKFLDKPVEPFDPASALDLSLLGEKDARHVREQPTDLAIALGLAVVDLDAPGVSLSLLPDAEKTRRRFWRKEVLLYAAAAVLLLGLGLVGARAAHARAVQAAFKQELDATKRKADGWSSEFDELEGKRKLARARASAIAAPVRESAFLFQALAGLRAARSEGLWLTRIAAEPTVERSAGEAGLPVLSVRGVVGEAPAAARRILQAFLGRLGAQVPGVRVETKSSHKAADSDRTEFELLVRAPGEPAGTAHVGREEEDR